MFEFPAKSFEFIFGEFFPHLSFFRDSASVSFRSQKEKDASLSETDSASEKEEEDTEMEYIFSLFGNPYNLRSGGGGSVSEKNLGKPVVAVIRLSGVIATSPVDSLHAPLAGKISFGSTKDTIDEAFHKASGVILVIDSPGGSPVQSDLLGNYLRKKAEETGKPLLALVEDCAASGGYWIAASADRIYVNRNSAVGSIGVISMGLCFEKALRSFGIEPVVVTSVPDKAATMNPLKAMGPEEMAILKRNTSTMHKNFVEWVKSRRPEVKEDVFTGQVFIGEEAVKVGLADEVSYLEEVIEDNFPERVEVVEFPEKRPVDIASLLPFLGGSLSEAIGNTIRDVFEEGLVAPGPKISM